jgi:hypothetical protein
MEVFWQKKPFFKKGGNILRGEGAWTKNKEGRDFLKQISCLRKIK